MDEEKIEKLQAEISRLKEELRGREAAMPAHSARPHQLQAIEDLEERIVAKERDLKSLET